MSHKIHQRKTDMLYNNITEKILGLQEVIIKKCEETESICRIEIELQRKRCICPCCGRMTDRIHDYRKQVIKDYCGIMGLNQKDLENKAFWLIPFFF